MKNEKRSMMMKTIVTILLVVGTTLMSCRKNDPAPEIPFELPEKSAQLIESDNLFGLELFKKVAANAQPNDNTMISPLSVAVALGMTYNGADGETKAEMEKVLKLNGLTTEQINNSHKALLSALKSADPDVLLKIANAIYYHQGINVLDEFIRTNKNYYDAEINVLNFADPKTLDIINNWVANKTHDKIPTILDEIEPDLVMVLLNAIYFNGIWKYKFNENKTHNLPFLHGDGQYRDVETMNQEASFDYYKNNLFSAVHLPYGKEHYQMTVFLPEKGKTTADVMEAFSFESWAEWKKGFKKEEKVEVTMPRFKFEFEKELNNVLADMGMPKAFIPHVADFSKINGQRDLYIGFVKHKTYVDVNENGTEAAAVTAVGMFNTSMPIDPPAKIHFKVDRPFLFTITEKSTGTVLFIGEVRAPQYK